MPNNLDEKIAVRVSLNVVIANAFLSALKLFAGIASNSSAMLSDAVHSLSDVMSAVVVMIGASLAGRQPDKEHQYGHERMECVAAIILSAILFSTGLSIGWSGVQKILLNNEGKLAVPGSLALVAAVVSIIVQEVMFHYAYKAAKQIDSTSLMADAWHHRSDALASIGSFIGVLGARMGFPVLDPVACVIICALILKVACSIFIDAIGKMTDRACDDAVVDEINAAILDNGDVLGVDQIKTRVFGNRIYVDVEISVNCDATLKEAHDTAQKVHDAIEAQIPKVKHCMVHVNPAGTEVDLHTVNIMESDGVPE